MRLPSDVLDRVRGALVVAALATCSHEAKAIQPSPSAVTATTGTAGVASATPAPAPLDPVHYTSADEAERLARLDSEEAAGLGARRARLERFAAQHREVQLDRQQRMLLSILGTSGTGGTLGTIGVNTLGRQLESTGCNACGRG